MSSSRCTLHFFRLIICLNRKHFAGKFITSSLAVLIEKPSCIFSSMLTVSQYSNHCCINWTNFPINNILIPSHCLKVSNKNVDLVSFRVIGIIQFHLNYSRTQFFYIISKKRLQKIHKLNFKKNFVCLRSLVLI